MTTEEMGTPAAEPHAPAGWHVDPDDPHVLRWWDGRTWGDAVKPRLVAAAEDQTRIYTEQLRVMVGIRNDVATIKSIAIFWFLLTILGMIAIVVVYGNAGH